MDATAWATTGLAIVTAALAGVSVWSILGNFALNKKEFKRKLTKELIEWAEDIIISDNKDKLHSPISQKEYMENVARLLGESLLVPIKEINELLTDDIFILQTPSKRGILVEKAKNFIELATKLLINNLS